MKRLILLLAITLSATAFGQKQKITVEGDTAFVDGTPFVIIKDVKHTLDLEIQSLQGVALVFLKSQSIYNPSSVSQSNPDGKDNYFEVTFFHDKKQCEIKHFPSLRKQAAKWLLENNLIKDGAVNQEAEDKMVLLNGNGYTKKAGGTTVIINN